MSKEKLLIDLQKGSNLRVRRFKNHDRLYWLSEKQELNIVANLRGKIEELDKETQDYILQNAIFLN